MIVVGDSEKESKVMERKRQKEEIFVVQSIMETQRMVRLMVFVFI